MKLIRQNWKAVAASLVAGLSTQMAQAQLDPSTMSFLPQYMSQIAQSGNRQSTLIASAPTLSASASQIKENKITPTNAAIATGAASLTLLLLSYPALLAAGHISRKKREAETIAIEPVKKTALLDSATQPPRL